MNTLIIYAAKYLIILPVLVLIWLAMRLDPKKRINLGWTMLMGALIAGILDKIGGMLFYDTRPFVSQHLTPLIKHAADNGFPSEHTLLATTLAVVVGFYNRRLGWLLAAAAVIIGAARIAAHVHSPVDIMGSLAMAVAAGWLSKFIVSRWLAKHDVDRQ
jgi:undecaprenyl-diphosphatase